jgi:hypothetical protein
VPVWSTTLAGDGFPELIVGGLASGARAESFHNDHGAFEKRAPPN